MDAKIEDVRKEIEKKYIENVGQKMQAKATPIREAVILLPDNDNDKNLENLLALNDALKEKYGIQAFQVHIHNDEGHIDDEGKPSIIITPTLFTIGQMTREKPKS